MSAITGFVTGHKRLDRKLRKFTRRTQRRLIRNSQNRGLTIVRKAAASEAPVGENKAVRRAVGKRFGKNKTTDIYEAKVGMHVGRRRTEASRKKATAASHGHFVILGTVRRYTKTGADRGVMPSNDFVLRGYRRSASSARTVQIATLSKGIDKELNKQVT